jgi:hypothetical protein
MTVRELLNHRRIGSFFGRLLGLAASTILMQLGLVVAGCAAQPDPSKSDSEAKTAGVIPASETSQSELGVSAWTVTFTDGGYFMVGRDDAGETRFAFRTEIGASGGLYETAVAKAAVLEFTAVDGQINTGRNDFVEHSDALRAANLAMGDLSAALASSAPSGTHPQSVPPLGASSGIHPNGGPSLVGGDVPLTPAKNCDSVVLVSDSGNTASCGAILNQRSNLSAGLYQCQADNRCVLSTTKNNMCVPCNDLWRQYQVIDKVRDIPSCNQCAWTDPNGANTAGSRTSGNGSSGVLLSP